MFSTRADFNRVKMGHFTLFIYFFYPLLRTYFTPIYFFQFLPDPAHKYADTWWTNNVFVYSLYWCWRQKRDPSITAVEFARINQETWYLRTVVYVRWCRLWVVWGEDSIKLFILWIDTGYFQSTCTRMYSKYFSVIIQVYFKSYKLYSYLKFNCVFVIPHWLGVHCGHRLL